MSQQTIDFSRSTRLRAIDDLKLPPTETVRGILFRLKSLLRCVDDFAGKDSRCWASMKAIADKLGCSRRTAQLMMADAVRLKLIETIPRGQHATAFHDLNWSLIFNWSSEFPDFPAVQTVAPLDECQGRNECIQGRNQCAPGAQSVRARGVDDCAPTVKGTGKGTEKGTSILHSGFETQVSEPISESSEDGFFTVTEGFQSQPELENDSMNQSTLRFDDEPKPVLALIVSKPPQRTWVSSYADIWFDVFGGEMPCTVFATALRKLEKAHGVEETIRRWENYCEAHRHKGEFANAAKFSQTWGQWLTNRQHDPTGNVTTAASYVQRLKEKEYA